MQCSSQPATAATVAQQPYNSYCKGGSATVLQQSPRNKAQQPATAFATRVQQPATARPDTPATAQHASIEVAKLLRPSIHNPRSRFVALGLLRFALLFPHALPDWLLRRGQNEFDFIHGVSSGRPWCVPGVSPQVQGVGRTTGLPIQFSRVPTLKVPWVLLGCGPWRAASGAE